MDPSLHISDGGVVTLKPSYKTEGIETHTCTTCGETWTVTIPKREKDPNVLLGDANADGTITNLDILEIYQYIYDSEVYVMNDEYAADVNCDGEITNADLLHIFRYIYSPEEYPLE